MLISTLWDTMTSAKLRLDEGCTIYLANTRLYL